MERAGPGRRGLADHHQRLPLRRRAGRSLFARHPAPGAGSRRPAARSTASAPSSTSARRAATTWSRATPGASTHAALQLGAVALRLHAQCVSHAPTATALQARRCRLSCRPPTAPALSHAAQRWGAARGPALRRVQLQPLAISLAPARRASRSSCPARPPRLRRPVRCRAGAIDAQAHLMRDLLRQFPPQLAASQRRADPRRRCRLRALNDSAATSRASSASWPAPARAAPPRRSRSGRRLTAHG